MLHWLNLRSSDEFSCPGYYRCQGETHCISPNQVCDGLRHCPKGDDERNCDHQCPASCECHGRVITCNSSFNFSTPIPNDVRKLTLSGVDVSNATSLFRNLHYLAVLVISNSGIIDVEFLPKLPNLLRLDLSGNYLPRLSATSFSSVPKLRYLDLSNNVRLTTIENGTFTELSDLEILNLQNTSLRKLTKNLFGNLTHLLMLNLSNTGLTEIEDGSFSSLTSVQTLDIHKNEIQQFGRHIFGDLKSLEKMYTDSYQLCCDVMRPEYLLPKDCISTVQVISSCTDLLGESILRVMLWLIAVIAMFGNLMVLVYRFKYDRKSLRRSYGVFVTNLSISDFLMGAYMVIVGCADAAYKGTYVLNDYHWRHSTLCMLAGFLSTMSTEASCIYISLITLDRFLAMEFPYGDIKFTRSSTVISIIVTWTVAIGLAMVPLLPPFNHWELYSKNGVCLALPLSSERKPGWQYPTTIFVGFNFVMFLFIGIGQMLIYRAVRSSSKIRTSGASAADARIASRLFLVAFTDFLCWFPVGIMGILALQGYDINSEVYAWTAVTILPINSALNPLLYTLPGMIGAWKKTRKPQKTGAKTSAQGVSVPDGSSMKGVMVYVGNPTHDMMTLHEVLQSSNLQHHIKCDLFSLIVANIHDLEQREKKYEPITDKKIFVSRNEDCGITSVCFSLSPDRVRNNFVEDVFYLNRLLLDETDTGETHKKWPRKTQETDIQVPEDSSMTGVRVYMGNPTDDMVTLQEVLQSRDLHNAVKCDLFSLIGSHLHDLQQRERTFEPIPDRTIFISKNENGISSVCLSLKADPYLDNVEEDVSYPNLLFIDEPEPRETVEIRLEDEPESRVTVEIHREDEPEARVAVEIHREDEPEARVAVKIHREDEPEARVAVEIHREDEPEARVAVEIHREDEPEARVAVEIHREDEPEARVAVEIHREDESEARVAVEIHREDEPEARVTVEIHREAESEARESRAIQVEAEREAGVTEEMHAVDDHKPEDAAEINFVDEPKPEDTVEIHVEDVEDVGEMHSSVLT